MGVSPPKKQQIIDFTENLNEVIYLIHYHYYPEAA